MVKCYRHSLLFHCRKRYYQKTAGKKLGGINIYMYICIYKTCVLPEKSGKTVDLTDIIACFSSYIYSVLCDRIVHYTHYILIESVVKIHSLAMTSSRDSQNVRFLPRTHTREAS